MSSSWEVLHFGEVLKRSWWGPGERNVELPVYLFWGLYPLEKEGSFGSFCISSFISLGPSHGGDGGGEECMFGCP